MPDVALSSTAAWDLKTHYIFDSSMVIWRIISLQRLSGFGVPIPAMSHDLLGLGASTKARELSSDHCVAKLLQITIGNDRRYVYYFSGWHICLDLVVFIFMFGYKEAQQPEI